MESNHHSEQQHVSGHDMREGHYGKGREDHDHAGMVADFKMRFWISLLITAIGAIFIVDFYVGGTTVRGKFFLRS